uniref:Uncharacterized protein n=1 Tax=Phytophthora ramorum TaxID=164328 RepID=H3GYA6_PHYRM
MAPPLAPAAPVFGLPLSIVFARRESPMLDLMQALRQPSADELRGLMLSDEELGDLEHLEHDADAAVMSIMLPATLSEDEDVDSLWSAALSEPPTPQDEPMADDLVSGEQSESGPDEILTMMAAPQASVHADALFASSAVAPLPLEKKRRGRKPSPKTPDKKPKRAPPSEAKARLRSYERRSRHKREHTMMTMKETVAAMESRIRSLCDGGKRESPLRQSISDLTLEATHLTNHNYNLRKALDDHRFFHSMLQLEYDHRETTSDSVAEELFDLQAPRSWRPMEEATCLRIMRDSFLEIDAFSNSEDFVSSGLEICGWREKRKLVGNNVNFMFHKTFAKDCSEDLAARSWEMRAVQDQVTRYFGHSLEVKVEVLQRFENDVVVVRRKIKHTIDGWVHHTIYLLFRTKTPDGHLVCIRDMNPEDADDLHLMSGSATSAPSQCVIWSKAFIWWKFTTLPEVEGQRIRGFEVEYGGSLGSATQADAAFWMREVLVLALRWENLVSLSASCVCFVRMEAALASAAKQPRWTGQDCVCLGMALFVLINVIMCLWVTVTSESTAHRQANAVFRALENASTIEFNLTMQTNGSAGLLNVTGRLHPRLSECCSHRLHFDGRMDVSSTNSSDVFVLTNHRGYRLRTSSANATCLTTLDVPPLHTLADTVHSAFRPVTYAEFGVNCKPLQFTFYDTPFAVCAEDWLRSILKEAQHPPPLSILPPSGEQQDPVLVIHGKQSTLTVKVLSDTTADADQPFEKPERCEFLEGPMTSGESCSTQSMHCPGPHIHACKKREVS